MDRCSLPVGAPFKLFVYGILRGGEKRMHHHTGRYRPKLVAGEIRTAEKYCMISGGIAYVQERGKDSILGDVYQITADKSVSEHIHPMEVGAGYELKPIEVPGHKNVWAYFDRRGLLPTKGMLGLKIVKSGDYLKHQQEEMKAWDKL